MTSLLESAAAPRQRGAAVAAAAATALLTVLVMPFASVALPAIPVLLPMAGAIAAAAQALTAAMLTARYRETGLSSAAVLAVAYATALGTSLALLASMPGVAAQTGILRGAAFFSEWYFAAGCLLFASQVAAFVGADDAERLERPATARRFLERTVFASAALVAIGIALVPLLSSPAAAVLRHVPGIAIRLFAAVPALALAAAAARAFATASARRGVSSVRLWLGVVALAELACLVLSIEFAGPRFGIGWLAVLGFWLLGSSVFLFAMIDAVAETLARLELRTESLYEQAVSDELTGLLNRRGFNERFEQQVRRSARDAEALALLLLDVDDFKRYNDSFGHQHGDRALATVARVVASMLRRSGDAGARIGGDEFAVLLPKTDLPGALAVAERIRSGVERLALPQGAGARHPHLSLTIGVCAADFSTGSTTVGNVEPGALLGGADAALYAAKDAGRNCVRAREAAAELRA